MRRPDRAPRAARALCAAALLAALLRAPAAGAETPPGFYLRAGGGAALGEHSIYTDVDPTSAGCVFCGFGDPAKFRASALFDAGAGYRFSSAFRADVTVDYMPALVENGEFFFPVTGPLSTSGKIDSLVALANAYLDLTNVLPDVLSDNQPYLTAGVGVSRNDMRPTTMYVPLFVSTPFTISGNATTNVAWSLGAGVGCPVATDLTVDLGYRYINLGRVQSGTEVTSSSGTNPVSAIRAELSVHTLTLALRYSF